jgi:hypothetical protein
MKEDEEVDYKYTILTKTHKLLKLSDIKGFHPGSKMVLGEYDHNRRKWTRFTFTFDEVLPVKGTLKKYYTFEIKGRSKFLQDQSMSVSRKTGEIRHVLTSEISPVFLIKKTIVAARSSPIASATSFKEGTVRKGGDGHMWVVSITKKGLYQAHRWVRQKASI